MASLSDYSTCELSDALIKLGSQNGGFIPDINLVSPDDTTVRIAGPAFTVKMVFTSDTDAPKPSQHFVDAAPSGSVMVISAPAAAKNAVWGGLMTAGAQARGVLGVVISGRCRDIGEHLEAKFPVFARGRSTVGQTPFTRPAELGGALTIAPQGDDLTSGFGAVEIKSGESWIVADRDGVVCVPADLVDAVLEQASKGRQVDARCMEDIMAGHGLEGVSTHVLCLSVCMEISTSKSNPRCLMFAVKRKRRRSVRCGDRAWTISYSFRLLNRIRFIPDQGTRSDPRGAPACINREGQTSLKSSPLPVQSMATIPALFAFAAPCVIIALAVGRVLRSRAAQKSRLDTWCPVLPLAQLTDKPSSFLSHKNASASIHSLIDVARELLRNPLPVRVPSKRPALPTHTASMPTRAPRTRAASAPSIDQQLYRAFAAPRAPPKRRNTAPAIMQVPRIVVTAPENDRPWTPGYVVPKQNTTGSLLVVPGAPSRTIHFCVRLP
ncbi:RraA-like protein [Exidia glandulosa HHB12029]|uniref:RraA-like protein n=1 Tax=Exidia glandulosa HHB12029 TaxID=1314781 RepID=A0A165JNL4_EXIGL|nr:RraA-like protein [Exidia glandulosa HHB12029]